MEQRVIKFRAWDQGVMVMNPLTFPERYPLNTLMQFTGLHDKNGKEIYEGDILRESDAELVFAVEYDSEYGMYKMPKEYDEEYIYPIGGIPTQVEVIGNIYENKELLHE